MAQDFFFVTERSQGVLVVSSMLNTVKAIEGHNGEMSPNMARTDT
jgi:hypothetical protein